ncbi:MAG: response regulator transcription factor [Candidatus Levybacteria bacterium]|nr:response regulator transcription factor [Candidatus Levybacteria bacterium]
MDRILLVEDDPAMAALYKDLFEKEGYNVALATDGEQGLKVALSTMPDVILLDVLLPKMNGLSVMMRVRATEWGKKEPIIILTNVDPDDTMMQNVVHGQPTYYLLKANTNPGEVLGKVKEVLTEKKKAMNTI